MWEDPPPPPAVGCGCMSQASVLKRHNTDTKAQNLTIFIDNSARGALHCDKRVISEALI